MAGDTTITIVCNFVDDPELRLTPTGQAVARFRVASTPRCLGKPCRERIPHVRAGTARWRQPS
ncbi:single-stranded DNA-binding protein [Planotetraspora sp. GP83]